MAASTVLASRNNNHHQSFMGEIPNYSNNNPHRILNPNPNPNQKPKSNKKKHFPNSAINGRPHSTTAVDPSALVATQSASDDAYSFNQKPIEPGYGNSFNYGPFVTYNVAKCSRSEINELRKKLVSDLERIRKLNDRIQVPDVNPNPRSANGKFKKLTGNKRLPMPFGSSNKEMKHFRQGLVNGGEVDESLMKNCRQALTKLMKHKLSWVFNKPVDAVALGLHDYHQIIKRPMDLGTVKSNLSKGLYSNPLDFASDVRLVFENAMLYNPRTDEVHGMADQLFRYFEELFRPIQAKPRAKDPNKREMNMEEKQKLGLGLQSMPPEKMPQLLQIIRKRNDQLAQEGDEIELDIEALDTETLWELDRFVTNWKKHVSKTKRQALLVNNVSAVAAPSVSADIDDVPMGEKIDSMKKSKKDAGEEDVDIGDEMPESSFPHVEIEKDDGGGQGAAAGHGNDNAASSSSSGSSSSSSGDSSSSSDSGSGSSSGSDSDADDAQS
ncbi:putative chromatin remodeler Bromodomain family [Helianthus annuus]|nr:putative chromatin remodeler Bromodomain family [Helianthus annuus]KAJ0608104.1 putative chromatin remodeler Bromodomain family [Helianthus annuus]KAJ0768170.1 putative chromatin remodeler Bromodomain family [Helianthus annuus]